MNFTNRSESMAAAIQTAESAANAAVPKANPRALADLLPSAARRRYLQWQDAAEELFAAVRIASDAHAETLADLRKAQLELEQVTDPWAAQRAGKGLHRVYPADVSDRKEKVERLEAELDRLAERLDATQHRKDAATAPLSACERYLKSIDGSGAELTAYAGKPPALRKDESPAEAVERFRKDLARTRADMHTVSSAPYPAADAKRKLREQIDALAREASPSTLALIEEADGQLIWPKRLVDVNFHLHASDGNGGSRMVTGAIHPHAPYAPAMLAWLYRDDLIAKLEVEIDALADDGAALTIEQRADKLAKLKVDALKAERAEEYFLTEAEHDGQRVERRADADARALLMIAGPEPRI